MSDLDLVTALRGGRADAAQLLYDVYGAGVYSFVHRRTGDPELSREIVQDVMVRIWQAAPRVDLAVGSLRSYVFQVARNAVIDAGRSSSRRPRVVRAVTPDEVGPVEDHVDSFVRSWLVSTALERLPEDHRAVLQLVYFRQLKVAEAAELLQIPEGTVKSRCYYALANLKSAFAELGVVGDDL